MTKREKEKLYADCRNIVRSDDKIDALESLYLTVKLMIGFEPSDEDIEYDREHNWNF